MDNTEIEVIQITGDTISIRRKRKKNLKVNEFKINDSILDNLRTCIRELIDSIILSGNWIKNDNVYLINLVKECIVILNKFKFLILEDKKKLILSIIQNIFKKELEKVENTTEEIKNKLLVGIDEIIEPSLELAIRTLNGELKINKNCILNFLNLLRRN